MTPTVSEAREWPSKRLKHVATYNDDALSEATDDFYEINYVEISNVSLQDGVKATEKLYFHEAPSRARRRVKTGDTLVSTVRTYLKSIATISDASDNLIASTGFCVVRPGPKTDPRYIGWCIKADPFVEAVVARSVGVSYPAINASELAKLEVPTPPLETQRRIAAFLDGKTARIDELIEKKRALLDLLAEKRQALITRAVTKGLNPDAPMKPTGIDWLGDIPAHWEVKRLRFALDGDTRNGIYKPKEEFHDSGVAFIQMGEAFASTKFSGPTKDRVFATAMELEKWGLREGDFLIARRSIVFEGSGKSALVSRITEPHLFESSMIRLRVNQPDIFSNFLHHFFGSSVCRAFILSVTKSVTISGIDSQQLKSTWVCFPPAKDAKLISDYCDGVEMDFAHLIKNTNRSISRLLEYRSALITVAVTGQLDLPDAAP